MHLKAEFTNRKRVIHAVVGPVLVAICGLLLWGTNEGRALDNASYDYLFRFGTHALANKVSIVVMDNDAYEEFHQSRGRPWDRALHARLLNKLADDGCALTVIDCFFREKGDADKDHALAQAMQRQRRVVLMAEQSRLEHPGLSGIHALLPTEPFYTAAGKKWGVAWLDPDMDMVVRKDWPFPAPGALQSLSEAAARMSNPSFAESTGERWLRYYGPGVQGSRLSYGFAIAKPPGFFKDQIVFIGSEPRTSIPDGEQDEFCTPYTRWTGETTGGVEIVATSFLNLVHGDWLRRVPAWLEVSGLIAAGLLFGGALRRVRLPVAFVFACGAAVLVTLSAILCSYYTNYWFSWLVVVAGQIPCSLVLLILTAVTTQRPESLPKNGHPYLSQASDQAVPKSPGYEIIHPPFGQGAYGTVWLARNTKGQWRALKTIYLTNFNNESAPYDREFSGVSRYQPISDKHSGLLRVEFVSEKLSDYFYYVMELGDSLTPGWEQVPSIYHPRDLANERERADRRRLPIRDCMKIGLQLSDALHFLHRHGLTHRDIKPQNVIFVNGQPKFADLGLIAQIRASSQERTNIGTPGYMPPPPELPGTPQSDVYALGVMLYVLITGRDPAYFPEIATTLEKAEDWKEFCGVNDIIRAACQPDLSKRYSSSLEMHEALKRALADSTGDVVDSHAL